MLIRALATLVQFEVYRYTGDFEYLLDKLPPCARYISTKACGPEVILHALKKACCYYIKPVRCLQRSWTLAYLLRKSGIPSELVIGAKLHPIKLHAWVEYDGLTVGKNATDDFTVLERR